jgi:quercetin dioxygenase-like cupin family protein
MMKKEKNNLTDLTDKSNHTDNKSNHTDNKSNHTAFLELEKSKAHIIVEILEYVPHAVVNKIIIKKTTGSVTVSSFDTGEELAEKTSPFDIYIQIIDGAAEVIIDDKKHMLGLGEGIIIPAHTSHCFNANQQFKMISTIIKSGYEE